MKSGSAIFEIYDYCSTEKINESDSSIVYLGYNKKSNIPVILKVLNMQTPSEKYLVRYKRDYQITHDYSNSSKYIIKSIELIEDKKLVAVVEEYFGGSSLSRIMQQKPLSLNEALIYGIELCKAIAEIHHIGIIHKNINPKNILINQETGILKLIDFSIASTFSSEPTSIINPNVLDGTLAYSSPEQTGRMNYSLDYRTDLYSLGVCFYEMFTGKLPFEFEDPLELIHAHIARMPASLDTINTSVPKIISNIILKLLAKSPDDRYQSSWGIEADLKNCLKQLQDTGTIKQFDIAQHDNPLALIIPQRLYGRQEEIQNLLNVFEEVCQGSNRLMMVTGYSGIGKTSLVNETHKPITEKRGYYITGKFDQFQRHIPYSAFITAFKGLVDYLLSENNEVISNLRNKLNETLGQNASVLIEVLPDLALLLGPKEKIENLAPFEHNRMLGEAIQTLIGTISQKEHPLVIFIDDLQWIDTASLNLLKVIMQSVEIRYLFLIGAYRSNEVSATHPLIKMLDMLADEKISVGKITLTPLPVRAVGELISDATLCEISEVQELTNLAMQKTEGNPFFLIQFFKMLYHEKMLTIDVERKKWVWNIEEIKNQNITDNVVELMIQRLQKLPVETQELLSLASCIGASFNLPTLSTVLEKTVIEIYHKIFPAIQENYILPVSTSQLTSKKLTEAEILISQFRFQHDRIQQAGYALLDEKQKAQYHFKIGSQLLDKLSEQDREERLFEIVNHLNQAKSLIPSDLESQWLDLNLQAVVKAKKTAAYDAALFYTKTGIENLRSDCWETQYKTTFTFYKEWVELEYLIGNFEASEKVFYEALKNAQSNLDKCELYLIPIVQLFFLNQYEESIQLGRKALELIDIVLPDIDTILNEIDNEKKLFDKNIEGKVIASLVDLPEMTDPRIKMALAILNKISSSAAYDNRLLYQYIAVKRSNLTLEYGNNRLSPAGYGTLGILCGPVWNDPKTGYEISKLAVGLSEKYDDLRQQTVTLCLLGYSTPWVKHFRHAFSIFDESVQLCQVSGEYLYGMHALIAKVVYHFFSGLPLGKLLPELQESNELFKKFKYEVGCTTVDASTIIINNLQGKPTKLFDFVSGVDLSESALLDLCDIHKVNFTKMLYSFYKSIVYFIYGEIDEAFLLNQEARKTAEDYTFWEIFAELTFYNSLIIISKLHRMDPDERSIFKDQLANNVNRLKGWAENSPENFQHKYSLVKAEIARMNGDSLAAINFYNEAITSAQKNNFIQQEALANELYGKYCLELGYWYFAYLSLMKACSLYAIWGAAAKVKLMAMQYPEILTATDVDKSLSIETSELTQSGRSFDLMTLLKASQTISREFSMTNLVNKLLHLLIENVGAQRAVLLLENNYQLFIEGDYDIDLHKAINILNSVPLDENQRIPKMIIDYVERTKNNVVLINASSDEQFGKDPYILKEKPKSILCAPIMNKNEFVGIFYFENNIISGAFTKDRVEILNVLSTQAAISIENARLHTCLDRFVPHEFLSNLKKKNILDINSGDQIQKTMTVMFLDIRNFTTLAERKSPSEIFNIINKFLGIMNPIIKACNGFVNQYIGDAIMSIFPMSADDAIDAAVKMQEALRAYNNEQRKINGDILNIGIGIDTGPMMLGTVGDKDHIAGAVVSDVVNVASRLENLTKFYGTPILVSENLVESLKDPVKYSTRFIAKVRVKGREAVLSIHEVLEGNAPEIAAMKNKTKEQFLEGLNFYYEKKFTEAGVRFNSVYNENPQDITANIYLRRSGKYVWEGIPPGWSGIQEMVEKEGNF